MAKLHLVPGNERTTINDRKLYDLACTLWADPTLRARWLRAVRVLRTQTKKGWVIDQLVVKTPDDRTLK